MEFIIDKFMLIQEYSTGGKQNGVVVVLRLCIASSVIDKVIQFKLMLESGEGCMTKILSIICANRQRRLRRN